MASLAKERLLEFYYWMQLTRRVEEQLVKLFRQNRLHSGVYPSLGQEAISVGSARALEPCDWLAPMVRNAAALLIRGFQPRDLFRLQMGRADSPTGGTDGMHFGDLARRVVAPISMLGDLLPVMAGIGLAARYLGRREVALTYIGDGGSSTGVFHEALNFAAVHRAPFVLILENNQWAYSTPTYLQAATRDFADRARAYGIPGVTVDGNDVVAVYETTRQAVERARRGRGPTLIEARTFRRTGHAMHDPAHYVPDWMRQQWEARDPIARFADYLTRHKLWSSAERQQMAARMDAYLNDEVAAAEASPLPPPARAAEGVYCHGCHEVRADWQRSPEELRAARNLPAEWFAGRQPALAPAATAARRAPGRTSARQAPAAGQDAAATVRGNAR